MLAIAGAKGGCGKTTTTLGLAAAFARRGAETLAVDCDRQQPDLHVWAEVDSEPTCAAIDRTTAWRSVAQEVPGRPGVYVLPGPTMSQSVDYERVLDDLDADGTRVLLDCPSGTGPDVVEPLSVADGVVVVTTGTKQSLRDTRKTVDLARRLEVPILGSILTHCEEVPAEYHERFDLPVLAVVPEYGSPLADDAAGVDYANLADELGADDDGEEVTDVEPGESAGAETAADDAVADDGPDATPAIGNSGGESDDDQSTTGGTVADAGEEEPAGTTPEAVAVSADGNGAGPVEVPATGGPAPAEAAEGDWHRIDGLDTGIEAFDRAVGGVPAGSVVALEADPASQSEQLLYRATATRGTLYVSTIRSEPLVRDALANAPVEVGSPTVRTVPEGAIDEAEQLIAEVPAGSTVVVDAVDALERAEPAAYAEFLDSVKRQLLESGSIAILHCLADPAEPTNRSTTRHVADAVFSFESRPDGVDELTVPKLRTNGAYSEPLALRLDGREPPATDGTD